MVHCDPYYDGSLCDEQVINSLWRTRLPTHPYLTRPAAERHAKLRRKIALPE